MFTVCPKCALTLVVTAADLRVAQGYVRCGRCSSVFNALARLSDERAAAGAGEEPLPVEAPVTPQTVAAAPDVPTDAPGANADAAADVEAEIPDDALEFDPTRTDVAAVFVDPPPNPQWTAATGSFKAMKAARDEAPEAPPDPQLEVEVDAAFLASMLRSEAADAAPGAARPAPPSARVSEPAATPPPTAATPPPPRPHAPRPSAAQALPPVSRGRPGPRHAAPHLRPDAEARVQPAPAPRAATDVASSAASDPAAIEESAPDWRLDADEEPSGQERVGMDAYLTPQLWTTGTALAALLLLVQIVNHYRDDLAATARFNRPLTTLYGALGVHLMPHWDLHAYDVRQLGASVDPGTAGLITVRASIKNGAAHPQPLPLLRVTLQDRFGNRIASSDVAPRFYLPPAVPASSFLAGGQRIDAEMGFVDPGADAVGFEIDACLPASSGGVTCANDASSR